MGALNESLYVRNGQAMISMHIELEPGASQPAESLSPIRAAHSWGDIAQ